MYDKIGGEMSKIVSKFILNFTNKAKPILIKIFPIELLRKIKRSLVNKIISNDIKYVRYKFDRNKYPDGINVIGFVKGETGLGQSCRMLIGALDIGDINYTVYNYNHISSMRQNDTTYDDKITNTTPYNINLIHINPSDLALVNTTFNKKIWDYKYNIGFWLWELEEFPDEWIKCFNYVDEIWTPSEFASNAIRKKTSLPVKTIKYPIDAPTDLKIYNRKYFNLPSSIFLYLIMYDCNSNTERKNPMSSIKAFKTAFSSDNKDVGIVIKINNPQDKDLQIIEKELKDYSNVFIIPKIMTKIEVNSLIKSCNVLVSLHRSEGFGLPLAEAMYLGVPTIATKWSANVEFMNEDIACMVDYKFITLDRDYGVYRRGNRWADADLDQAAEFMIKLYKDQKYRLIMTGKAQKYIIDNLNKEICFNDIKNRIIEIYKGEA